MTAEERIAQLEAEVRSLRLVNEGLAVAVRAANRRLEQEGDALATLAARRETARVKKQQQRALRAMSRDSVPVMSPGQTRDIAGTPPPSSSSPFPSSFPPSPEPSSPYPLSFPPSSPPSPFPPASRSAPEQRHLLSEEKSVKAKKPKAEAPGDPRHAPLVKALTDAGWPFDGGRDAAQVKGLLALADQQEATRGELAGVEVLRRARIAWGQFPGFHSARTLSALRSKWGEFATADQGRGPAPPSDFEAPMVVPKFSWLEDPT